MENADLDLRTFDPLFTLPFDPPKTESPLSTWEDTDEDHANATNLQAQAQP
jgi:hypothetical protein